MGEINGGVSKAIGFKGFFKAGGPMGCLAGGVGVLGLLSHALIRGGGGGAGMETAGGGGGGGTETGDCIDGTKTGKIGGGGGGGDGITVALCCTEPPFITGDSTFCSESFKITGDDSSLPLEYVSGGIDELIWDGELCSSELQILSGDATIEFLGDDSSLLCEYLSGDNNNTKSFISKGVEVTMVFLSEALETLGDNPSFSPEYVSGDDEAGEYGGADSEAIGAVGILFEL